MTTPNLLNCDYIRDNFGDHLIFNGGYSAFLMGFLLAGFLAAVDFGFVFTVLVFLAATFFAGAFSYFSIALANFSMFFPSSLNSFCTAFRSCLMVILSPSSTIHRVFILIFDTCHPSGTTFPRSASINLHTVPQIHCRLWFHYYKGIQSPNIRFHATVPDQNCRSSLNFHKQVIYRYRSPSSVIYRCT